jgi:hypothetical protein
MRIKSLPSEIYMVTVEYFWHDCDSSPSPKAFFYSEEEARACAKSLGWSSGDYSHYGYKHDVEKVQIK